eukprot:919234_1
MAPSFVTISCLLVHVVNGMEWRNIWSDNDGTGDSWVCHVGRGNEDDCKFRHGLRCQYDNCYELGQRNYMERSTPISSYAGLSLRLSLYVHIEEKADASENDRCRIWFAYDDDTYDMDTPNWQCGVPFDGVETIEIPSSIEKNTLKIVLGVYDEDHRHCNFDTIKLKYQLPATPAPTDRPTPSPTKRPTDQTKSPTSSPTT